MEHPSLNKKGGLQFQLSKSWDRPLRVVPSRLVTWPTLKGHAIRLMKFSDTGRNVTRLQSKFRIYTKFSLKIIKTVRSQAKTLNLECHSWKIMLMERNLCNFVGKFIIEWDISVCFRQQIQKISTKIQIFGKNVDNIPGKLDLPML